MASLYRMSGGHSSPLRGLRDAGLQESKKKMSGKPPPEVPKGRTLCDLCKVRGPVHAMRSCFLQ